MATGSDITLAGATLAVQGTGSNSGTIDYADTTSTALLNHVSTTASANPTLTNFTKGDSIGISTQFNQASLSPLGGGNYQITLSENGTAVARFTVTSSSLTGDAFYPTINTETVGGVTYYVATLDPPAGGSNTGSFTNGAGSGLNGIGSLNSNGHDNGSGSLFNFGGTGGLTHAALTDLIGALTHGGYGSALNNLLHGSNIVGGSVNLQNSHTQNPLSGFGHNH